MKVFAYFFAGTTDVVNIVVQIDRTNGYDESNGNWKGAKRYYVLRDELNDEIVSEDVMDLGEVNMGVENTLVNFTNWAIDSYPAKHYVLVIWDDDNDDFLTMPELRNAMQCIESHLGRNLDIVCASGYAEPGEG